MDGSLKEEYIVGLSILATLGLGFMWWTFWNTVHKKDESIVKILSSPSFFKTLTVMGVVAATVVLSLAGKLEGEITGAILSGIAGYVLGHVSNLKEESGSEKINKLKKSDIDSADS